MIVFLILEFGVIFHPIMGLHLSIMGAEFTMSFHQTFEGWHRGPAVCHPVPGSPQFDIVAVVLDVPAHNAVTIANDLGLSTSYDSRSFMANGVSDV